MRRLSGVTVSLLLLSCPLQANWFQNSEQQAEAAYNQGHYEEAAKLFQQRVVDAVEAGAEGVEHRVVDEELARGSDGIDLLRAAVAAPDPRRHHDERPRQGDSSAA